MKEIDGTDARRFLECALDLLCIADLGGTFVYVSPSWVAALGWSAEELCGRPYAEFIHPDDLESTRAAARDIAEGRRVFHLVNRYRHREGGYRWLEWSASRPSGESLIYATVRDISETRRQSLHGGQVESVSGVGSWEIDRERRLVWWSPATHAIHETDPDTFDPGLAAAMDFFPKEAQVVLAPAIERLLTGGEPYSIELPFRTARGRSRWVALTASAEKRDDKVVRTFGTSHDVTDACAQRERLKRMGDVAQRTTCLVVITDHLGCIIWANPAFEHRTGYPLNRLIGQRLAERIGLETSDSEDFARLIDSLSSHAAFRGELQLRDRRGEFYWADTDIQPTADSRGDFAGFVIVQTDITLRKQQAAELERTRNRLAATLAAVPDIVFEVDGDERYVELHCARPELLLVPPEAFLGRQMAEVLPPRVLAGARAAIEEANQHGTSKRFEYFLDLAADRRWFELCAARRAPAAADDLGGYVFVIQDISERVRAAEKVDYSNALLSKLFEASPVGIMLRDPTSGALLDGNPALLSMLKLGREQFLGLSIQSLLVPDVATSEMPTELAGHVSVEGRKRVSMLRADGSIFLARLLSLRFTDPSGRELEWTIAEDISQVERAQRMQREFVATLSHELRTPVTSILGCLGLMAGGAVGDLSSEARRLAGLALREGRRLTLLLDDVLDLDRLDASQIRIDLADVLIRPLLVQASEVARASPEGAWVRVLPGGESLRARVDPQRIGQILANLVSNAIKFSPVDASIDLGLEERGGRIRLFVRDRGPGVPVDFLDRLFSRFAQADASDSRRRGGTGLGLAIVRELAQRMGGEAGHERPVDGGACFYAEFPCVP